MRNRNVTDAYLFGAKDKRLELKEGDISILIHEFSDGRYCMDTVRVTAMRARTAAFQVF